MDQWQSHYKRQNIQSRWWQKQLKGADKSWLGTWWRHQMETFSALLAICAWNSPVPGEFHAQRPVTRSFDFFFDPRLNKWLSKQSWGWRFETLSWPLRRHCNVIIMHNAHNLQTFNITRITCKRLVIFSLLFNSTMIYPATYVCNNLQVRVIVQYILGCYHKKPFLKSANLSGLSHHIMYITQVFF